MSQIRKTQLKDTIRKEYIDVLKEMKKNENSFNQVAYEHVIHELIKKGILNEAWTDYIGQDAGLRKHLRQASNNPFFDDEERSAYGQMAKEYTPRGEKERVKHQRNALYGDVAGQYFDDSERMEQGSAANVSPQEWAFYGDQPRDADEAEQAPEGETPFPPGWGPEDDPFGIDTAHAQETQETELPAHFQNQLVTITQGTPKEFRDNVKQVGNKVYDSLKRADMGDVNDEMLGEMTLAIIQTVAGAMGSTSGRSWVGKEYKNPMTGETEKKPDAASLPSDEQAREMAGQLSFIEGIDKKDIIAEVQKRLLGN